MQQTYINVYIIFCYFFGKLFFILFCLNYVTLHEYISRQISELNVLFPAFILDYYEIYALNKWQESILYFLYKIKQLDNIHLTGVERSSETTDIKQFCRTSNGTLVSVNDLRDMPS